MTQTHDAIHVTQAKCKKSAIWTVACVDKPTWSKTHIRGSRLFQTRWVSCLSLSTRENNCNQRADVSPFCPLQTGVETASSASSREISLTSKARLEEKRASILAAAEERKELGDRVFEVASRFAQLDKANCRFVESAPSCAVAPLSAHAFPETSCTRFARLSFSPTPTPLFNILVL